MDRRYLIADVFTDVPFGGNPLAVFLDGSFLQARQMQAIAREMNLSETTFVTAGSAPGHFRVRIFTPAVELPFAGHPTIGTAVALAQTGATGARGEIVLEEEVGPVRVTLGPSRATLHREGVPGEAVCRVDVAGAAESLGLAPTAVTASPWTAGYGFPVVFIPLADSGSVAACAFRADRWEAAGGMPNGAYVFAITATGDGTASLRARMFGPAQGVAEDPATGSAAAALAGSILRFMPGSVVRSSVGRGLRLTIAQGVEMGRPSRIETETRYTDFGRVAGVSVGGGVVIVGDGKLLHLP
jgi:trans-2,3-dihydro-3-hydroxyanthranilate isomerase